MSKDDLAAVDDAAAGASVAVGGSQHAASGSNNEDKRRERGKLMCCSWKTNERRKTWSYAADHAGFPRWAVTGEVLVERAASPFVLAGQRGGGRLETMKNFSLDPFCSEQGLRGGW
jgi:hypothetical protein